jgi:hypothetical protein
MTSDEGPNARDDRSDHNDGHRDRIGIGGGDDSVTRIQLAARWSESYSQKNDTLGGILKRFRAAYEYLDAVTHGVEPPDIEADLARTPVAPEPASAAQAPAPASAPAPAPAPPPPAPTPAPAPAPPPPWA